ncbi:energy transducer TonB [Mesorhizobium sp.]|uniref:energy transducer TonB family protein n=1 Tax=Mesorhizobium sp. TaxID=1871066 RepID=UPI00120AAC9C|nr:energy transducer TonB [Mesorhizobium sp.]TIS58530.1 MAG: TonB family protein [Mesorhizobium sp.]TIS88900.1 MAG: TonB family protein [Mesorhizobium sp.]
MTQPAAVLRSNDLPRFGAREIALWAAAAALVLVAHAAIAYAMQNWRPADDADGGPPPAVVIEMSPMALAPAVQEQAAVPDAVAPDQAEPVEETEKTAEAKPVTEPEAEEPEPAAKEAEPVTEQPLPADEVDATQPSVAERPDRPPPLQDVVPDTVETVAPDVVIPLPRPKPEAPLETKAKKPAEAKAKKPVEKKPVEKPRQRPKKEKAEPAKTVTTASVDAKPAPRTAASKPAEAAARSGVSPARWNSKLRSWINRHTRYPSAARSRRAEGSASVTFTVDASGRVLSARLVQSSGDENLDRAALNALQGASVPAPPPELGSRVTRTAPFVFSLRN